MANTEKKAYVFPEIQSFDIDNFNDITAMAHVTAGPCGGGLFNCDC